MLQDCNLKANVKETRFQRKGAFLEDMFPFQCGQIARTVNCDGAATSPKIGKKMGF